MLEVLNIRTGCVDDNEQSDDEFDIEAPRPPAVLRGGMMPSSYSDGTSAINSTANLAAGESQTDLLADFPPTANEFSAQTGNSVNSFARLSLDKEQIKEALGNIFNSDSRWFQNFDEQVLKPVFLDNNSQPHREGSDSPSLH